MSEPAFCEEKKYYEFVICWFSPECGKLFRATKLAFTFDIDKDILYTLGMAVKKSCIQRETVSFSPVQVIFVNVVNIHL